MEYRYKCKIENTYDKWDSYGDIWNMDTDSYPHPHEIWIRIHMDIYEIYTAIDIPD